MKIQLINSIEKNLLIYLKFKKLHIFQKIMLDHFKYLMQEEKLDSMDLLLNLDLVLDLET